MFYEEKVIDGALMCRGTPNGKWQLVSYHVLTERLMKAEAAARTEERVPEGWQLVPIKPTSAMIEAAIHCLDGKNLLTEAAQGNAQTATKKEIQLFKVCNRWWAMIAARPAPPSPQAPRGECMSESQNCRKNNPSATDCCSLYSQYAANGGGTNVPK